jgi:hypothetical protein
MFAHRRYILRLPAHSRWCQVEYRVIITFLDWDETTFAKMGTDGPKLSSYRTQISRKMDTLWPGADQIGPNMGGLALALVML